jgi:hypothetical protein
MTSKGRLVAALSILNILLLERPPIMNTQPIKDQTARIRELNDTLRTTFLGGTIVVTNGVAALASEVRSQLLAAVRQFDAFSADDDPYGEHDFGAIKIDAQTFFFKIDYHDRSLTLHWPDPAHPTVTTLVLTVMRADEY